MILGAERQHLHPFARPAFLDSDSIGRERGGTGTRGAGRLSAYLLQARDGGQ